MFNNKEKIKSVLDDYVDIDNNYKKIKHRIYRKQNKKQFIRKLSVVVPVIILLVSASLIIKNSKMLNLSEEKPSNNNLSKDNIIINEVKNTSDNSMHYHYESKDYNLIDNIMIYKHLKEVKSLEVVIQKILYNEKKEKIYFGGFKSIEDNSKFIYLYITPKKNNNFIHEAIFENTQSSLIDNKKVYIVDNEGIIFIKFVKNDETYVIQTNITDSSVYIDLVKEIIKYRK